MTDQATIPTGQNKKKAPSSASTTSRIIKRMRAVITILALLLLSLALVIFFRSHAATFIVGEGTIRGTIHDKEGKPVSASIFVEHTKLEASTDPNGRFQIRGVPVGDQTIVISWMFAGYEAPVEIHRGGITDLGTISVPTGQRPDHPLPRLEWR